MRQNPSPKHGRPQIPVLWDRECRETPIAITVVNGIKRMSSRRGYDIRLYADCDSYLQDTAASSCLIAVGFESKRMLEILQLLQNAGKRAIVTGMDADHLDAHYSCATFSRRNATEQMLEYMLKMGCRSIALIGVGKHSVNDLVHTSAMFGYLAKHPYARGKCFEYGNHIDESFEAFYTAWQSFDAVLCTNAFVAVAFLQFCEQRDIAVPEALQVASIKDSYINRYCVPALTSLAVDFFAIGEQSVIVWKYIKEITDDHLRMRIAVLGRVIERGSTNGHPLRNTLTDGPEIFTQEYQGGPFYEDAKLQALTHIECCLQVCDELDMHIIRMILEGSSYETIAEALYLSGSSLQYRARKIFHTAQTNSRKEFVKLWRDHFTRSSRFEWQR